MQEEHQKLTNPTAQSSGVSAFEPGKGMAQLRQMGGELYEMRSGKPMPQHTTIAQMTGPSPVVKDEWIEKDLQDSYDAVISMQKQVEQVSAFGKQLEQESAQLQQEYANVGKLLQAYETSGSSQDAEAYLLAVDAYNKRHTAFQQAWAQYEKDSTVFDQYNKAYSKYEKAVGKYLQEHPEVEWNEMSGQELHGLLYDTLQEIKNQKRAGIDTKALEERASKMESVLQRKLSQYSGSDLVQLQGMAQSQWQARADNMGVWKKRHENTGRSLADDPDYDAYSDTFYYEQGKVRDLQERIKTAQQQKELEQNHGLWGSGFGDRLDLAAKAGVHQWMADMSTLADKAQDVVVNGEAKLIELTAKMYGKSSPLYDSLMDMAEKMRTEAAKPSRDAVETQQYVDELRREYQAGAGAIDGFILQQMESVSAMVMDIGMAGMSGQMSGTIGTAMMPKSSTYLAMRATGGGIQHAQEQGYGEIEQILYGTAVGALEWGSEQLFGGNPLYDEGKGLVTKMVEKVTDNPKILRMLYSKPFGVLGEGFEEVFVEFTTPTAEYLFTSKDEIDWASPEEIATAFAGGVFLGLIGTGVEATTNAVGNAKITREFNKLGDRVVQLNAAQGVIDRGLQADPVTDAYQNAVKLQKKLDAGKTITAKDMGKQLMANLEAINAGKLVDIEEVEDDPTVPEGKLQDPEDGFYAVAVGKRGDKNTYRLVQVHSDGSVEQLTVEGTDSLFGVKIAAEIQGMRVRHIDTVQNLVQIAEAIESEEIATEAAPRKGRSEEARKATERKGYESALRIVEQQSEERQAYLRSQYEKYKAEIEALEVGDVLYTADGDVAGNVVSAGEYGVTIVGEMLVERIPAGAFPSDTIVETLLEAGGYFEKNGTADTVSDMEEGSGLQWAGNAPAEVETVDAMEQLRQDLAEGKITDEEFDEAMEIIRQEESAAEQSMVEGLQWAGSETGERIATPSMAARNDSGVKTAAENNNTETEEMQYGTEQADEVSGRDRERAGERSGERSGRRTKNNALRAAARREEKAYHLRNVVRRAGIERTSLRSEGLPTGSDEKSLVRVPEELWTDDIKAAAKLAEDAGLELVPLVGTLRIMEGQSGRRITAAICNGKIYARADCDSMDILEEVRHEIFHDKADQNPELVKGLMQRITARYTDEDLQQLFNRYYDLYEGILPEDMDEVDVKEYIWKEMLADSYAEYQRYPEYAEPTLWADEVREAVEQVGTKNTANGGERFSLDSDRSNADEYDSDVGYKEYEVGPAIYDIRHRSAERRKDLVKIGTMPWLYRRLFSLKGNVYVSSSHLYQNIVSKEDAIADGRWVEGADYHDLGEPKVIEAILQSQDPMVLMESLKDYESPRLVAIVEETGNDGKPLIVVTELYTQMTAFGEKQDRNHVLITVYEKTRLPDYVKNTLEKGRILHIKEGLSADTQASLQLAGGISEEVLKQNVAQFNKKIKAFKEKNKINYSMETALTTGESEKSSNGLPILDTEYTEVLPAKAESYLRRVERELVETIGTQMEIPFMQRRGGLRDAVNQLAQEYLQNGDVSQQTVDELFDAASNGRYDSDANAREKLENAVHEALEDLRQHLETMDFEEEIEYNYAIKKARDVARAFQIEFTGEVSFLKGIRVYPGEAATVRHALKTGYGKISLNGKSGAVNTSVFCYLFKVDNGKVIITKAVKHEDLNIRKNVAREMYRSEQLRKDNEETVSKIENSGNRRGDFGDNFASTNGTGGYGENASLDGEKSRSELDRDLRQSAGVARGPRDVERVTLRIRQIEHELKYNIALTQRQRNDLARERKKLIEQRKELKKSMPRFSMETETAQVEPLTEEDVKQLYTELKTARNTAEKAVAKNLLTAEDELQIGKLLRGEISVESLDAEKHNVKGIKAVYEARVEYERIAKQIRQWNQSRKAQLRQEADAYLQTANDWKDKSAGLLYARETMERNIRDIVKDPELAEQIIAAYFEPVHKGTAEANKLKNDYRNKVRKLGLSRKVEKGNTVSEAHAVQLLGEAEDNIRILEKSRGRMKVRDGKTLDEWRGVVQALWESNPNMDEAKIRNAVEAFREIYDELFERMNDVRIRNGYEPVNYRSGYFPHFQPGDGGIMALFGKALGIDTQVNALPTTINGLTHTFRPGITWFGNAQERLGFNTAYDAVEGFDKYIEGVADVICHTDNIQRLRALASQIRYRTGDEGIRKQVDAVMADATLSEQDKQNRIEKIYESGRYTLSNFVVELEEYTNLLANKKSRHDRSVEGDVGRKIYTIVKNLESRVAANMVAVNPASWLTNFIPLTQGGASLERGMLLRGMWNTLRAGKEDDGLVDMSSFLTNRRGSDPIVKTWQQSASEKMSAPMEYIDQFVADSLVRARYYQNLKHDMSEDAAMREADAWVAGVMADRSKGSMPTLFGRKNPMTKLLTQFQLEVNNQLSYVMKDIPRDMRDKGIAALIAALIKFCLGAFLFDEVYEYFIGRRPALDPLGILNDTVGDLTGYELPNLVEMGIGAIKGEKPDFTTEKKGIHGAVSGLLGNVAEEVPFVGGLLGGGRIPISSAMPDGENLLNAALNSEWDSEKRWRTAAKELGGSAAYLVPPFGGGQIKKIVETVQAIYDHGSYNASGNLQYPVFSDSGVDWAGSAIVGSVFGKSSLPTAREWVESGFDGLNETYTQVYETMLQIGETDRKAWEVTKQLADAEKTEESSVATVRRQILREADISGEAKLAVYYAICANDDELELIESLDEVDPQALYETLDSMRGAEKTEEQSEAEIRRQILQQSEVSDETKLAIYKALCANEKETELLEDLSGAESDVLYEVITGMKGADKNVDKLIALFNSDLDEESMLTALAYVSDTESEKLAAASDYVDCDLYGKFLQSYFREYGYEDKNQERVEDILDHIPGLSDKERAALWQMSGKNWKPKNNPYSVAVGQKIYDALH